MKKLQKLTLKELGDLGLVLDRGETIGLKGGEGDLTYFIRYGEYLPDGTGYDPYTDVCYSLYGSSTGSGSGTSSSVTCEACEFWHLGNTGQPSSSGTPVMTPLGEYLTNTLPHQMGWGNHTN